MIHRYITDNLEISSYYKYFDEENYDEENYFEEKIKHRNRVSFKRAAWRMSFFKRAIVKEQFWKRIFEWTVYMKNRLIGLYLKRNPFVRISIGLLALPHAG